MKVIFNFTSFVTFQEGGKIIRSNLGRGASEKTPMFQGNFPSGRVAGFQGKILLKQKRFSFFQGNHPLGRVADFEMLKRMGKFI